MVSGALDYNSHTADGDQSNPDPFVTIQFPDIDTTLAQTSQKDNTLNPFWNEYGEATVTAAGQEVWFCVWDKDLVSNDPMYFSGTGNCKGFQNIIDFIRAGTATLTGTSDVQSVSVKIAPK